MTSDARMADSTSAFTSAARTRRSRIFSSAGVREVMAGNKGSTSGPIAISPFPPLALGQFVAAPALACRPALDLGGERLVARGLFRNLAKGQTRK